MQHLWNRALFSILVIVSVVSSGRQPIHAQARPNPDPAPASKSAGQGAYAQLPLSFEANRGQFDEPVRFVARHAHATFFFTPQEVAAVFTRGSEGTAERFALRLRFAGAPPRTSLGGLDPLPGRANYLIGNDPSRWRQGVPTYGRVVYRDLYPGTDLIYSGAGGRLKYDLLVRPGADLARVRLDYAGADGLRVNAVGQLEIETAWGVLVEEAPVAYTLPGPHGRHPRGEEEDRWRRQEAQRVRPLPAGLSGRPAGAQDIKARYVVRDDGTVGFAVGPYDPNRILVIDPALIYSTFVGGSSHEYGRALALDGAGNAVVTGYTGLTGFSDFPTTAGAYDTSYNGGIEDAFVLKLSEDGGSLLYSTFVGGSDGEEGCTLALDGAGNAVVAGWTTSSDFPTTAGAYDTVHSGGADVFVLKLAADGGSLLYSTFAGGGSSDRGTAVLLDGAGNAVVAGYTRSSDFPTTSGAYDTVHNGDDDVFVLKLAEDSSSLLYSTFVGGSNKEDARAVALDGAGNAVVAGYTGSSDFPTTAGAYDTSYNGAGSDAYVLKLATDGSSLLYSTFVGGLREDYGQAVTLDGTGAAVVTGMTWSADFPTSPGAYDRDCEGGPDVFVLKLAADGTSLLYGTFVCGQFSDRGYAVALDGEGNAVVAGQTSSPDFPTTPDAYDRSESGGDLFVLKLAADGGSLVYSTFVGGSGSEEGGALVLDGAGAATVAGYTDSDDFPTTPGAYDTGHNGDDDVFVLNLAFPLTAPTLTPIANADGDGDYLVDWSGVPGATAYTLEEDESPKFASPDVRYSGADSQYAVAGQSPGAWHYRVRASNAGEESPWSNAESVVVTGPVTAVSIAGPKGGYAGFSYPFSATVEPTWSRLPIAYTWEATGQAPVQHPGGDLDDEVGFTWASGTSGIQRVTVTADNTLGAASTTYLFAVTAPSDPGMLLVDTTADSNEPAHQACTAAPGDCSLRGAVSRANADPTHRYTLLLPPGSYALTVAGHDDANARGDLDILGQMVLSGAGADQTTVDGNESDRVFQVHSGATLEARGVTISRGWAQAGASGSPGGGDGAPGQPGGGVHIAAGAAVTMTQVALQGNHSGLGGAGSGDANSRDGDPDNDGTGGAGGCGAGIYNEGSLQLDHCAVHGNQAGNGGGGGWADPGVWGGHGGLGGSGAGLCNLGTASVTGSSFWENDAGSGGSGNDGGDGGHGGEGAGIYNQSTLTLADCVVTGNWAGDGGTQGINDGAFPILIGDGGDGGSGGGLWSDGTVKATNTLFVTNGAGLGYDSDFPGTDGSDGRGNALYSRGSARLAHTTIAGNAGGDGSGVVIGGSGSAEFYNTIVAGHTLGLSVGASATASFDGTLWEANGSDWDNDGTFNHSHDTSGDPAFLAPDAGDYHLGPASAAIDKGVNANVFADVDNQPRPHPSTGIQDLGADEYWVCVPIEQVGITGPSSGGVGAPLTLSAAVSPTDATPNLGYTWWPEPDAGQGTASATFTFGQPGETLVYVTVENCGGSQERAHAVRIEGRAIYLPLILRNY